MTVAALLEFVRPLVSAVAFLASAWATSCVFLVGGLVLVYWGTPANAFRMLSALSPRLSGAFHFLLFGLGASLSDLMSAFVLLVLANPDPIGIAMFEKLMVSSVLSNATVWCAVGMFVGPWLDRRGYRLAIEEAVGFAIGGVLAARLAGLLHTLLTGPVSEQPAVSGLFKVNAAYLGPNFVILMIAFAVHRAGVRRVIRAGSSASDGDGTLQPPL